jgi:hypothetical protein
MTTSFQFTITNSQFTLKERFASVYKTLYAQHIPSLKIENCKMKIAANRREGAQ